MKKLKNLTHEELIKHYKHLQILLADGDLIDINGIEMAHELKSVPAVVDDDITRYELQTRWESRKNSVKALSFQLSSILDTLEEVSYTANDLMAKSEAVSQSNEIGNYEFILSLVIWYDILTEVNIVSKSVQDHNMDINTSVKMVQSLLQFLHQYRENEFNLAKSAPNKLAKNADITVAFKNPRVRKKKKLFEYENVDEPMLNNEDRFRTNYFFIILDNANSRLRNALNSWRLIRTILDFCIELANNDLKDVDGFDLFSELIIFRSLVDEDTNSLQALNILKTSNGLFPNLTIALRIMLTIPVTSACAERMFSKLKLIKTYLRNQLG
ncbi:zinc finger MYM-type protein 1-like [Rhopalosiphum maidis]|uniref:zinc finger MYM-type protein 1-like n=1 Tax=Rhopalosiphum maidis TaxID=43146 RepID=UPI000EFEDB49|nr:zinc finger MYM-type protein 1-like [Rhopalosiphum maidis]